MFAIILLCGLVVVGDVNNAQDGVHLLWNISSTDLLEGENAEFEVRIENRTRDTVQLGPLEIGGAFPLLEVSKDSGKTWSEIQRAGGNPSGYVRGRTPISLKPGEVLRKQVVLYHDLGQVGNLPAGEYVLRLSLPIALESNEGTPVPLLNDGKAVDIKVRPSESMGEYRKFSLALDDATEAEQKKLFERFLGDHPQAPMAGMLVLQRSELILSTKELDSDAPAAVKDLQELAQNDKGLSWYRSKALTMLLAYYFERDLERYEEAAKALLRLEPDNKAAARALAEVERVKEKGNAAPVTAPNVDDK